jgi:PAS domain S-box-containing protein
VGKNKTIKTEHQLLFENEELQRLVHELEESLISIRNGEKDAIEAGNILETANSILAKEIIVLKQADKELQENENKFKNLVWDMQVGVLLQGPQAEILLSNPKALELLGISEDQLLGKTSFDPDWNVIHEDGSPFLADNHPVPQAIATHLPVRGVTMGVYHPVKRDRVWLLVDAMPQLNNNGNIRQVVCTFIDITRRKLAEDLLKESETIFRQTFEYSPIGKVMVGLDKRFIHCNNAFAASLGYSVEELIGKTITDVTHPEDKLIGIDEMIALAKGEITNSQVQKRYIRKDGETLWGDLTISLVRDHEDHPKYFLAIIQDISEKIKAEVITKNQIIELKRFNKIMVDREIKMIKLKQEVNSYCKKLNLDYKYSIPEDFNQ